MHPNPYEARARKKEIGEAHEPHQRICSWCRKTMVDGRKPATHGICPVCEAEHFPTEGES